MISFTKKNGILAKKPQYINGDNQSRLILKPRENTKPKNNNKVDDSTLKSTIVTMMQNCTLPNPPAIMKHYQDSDHLLNPQYEPIQLKLRRAEIFKKMGFNKQNFPDIPNNLFEYIKKSNSSWEKFPDQTRAYFQKDYNDFAKNYEEGIFSTYYYTHLAQYLDNDNKVLSRDESDQFYKEKLEPYIDVFTKKLSNQTLTFKEEALLQNPKYLHWASYLIDRHVKAENLLSTLSSHDCDIVEASSGNGAREIFLLLKPEQIKQAVGDKEHIRIFGRSNGTGIIATLNAVTDGKVKGALGFRNQDFPHLFIEPETEEYIKALMASSEGDGIKKLRFPITGNAPEEPIIISFAGGTPQMMVETKLFAPEFHFDKQPIRDKGAITEIFYPQASFSMLAKHIDQGLYDGRDYIVIGHDLQKSNDNAENYNKERQQFLQACQKKILPFLRAFPLDTVIEKTALKIKQSRFTQKQSFIKTKMETQP
ncbi:MAG: hypothetical protein ACJARD_001746 [Alphaproteobacteria bacterium]|jgi:hypothetical protein